MFQEEKPQLRSLLVTGFRYFTCDDTAVRIDGSYYGARPAPIDSHVAART